jgi:hypothetical protein
MSGNSSGILLIAVGLVALYIVLSDKYSCFVQFFDCLTGNEYTTPEGYTKSDSPATTTQPSQKPVSDPFDIWRIIRDLPRPTILVP